MGTKLSLVEDRLRALPTKALARMRRGVEKEGLRATLDGRLALTGHPRALGSALTHPHITTDFSESQLELITGVHPDATSCVEELTQIHQVVHRHLAGELMWAASMPCELPCDEQIPIGQYGNSNIGRAKTVYRNGLSHRYGRSMQTISGVHYNFSLPDELWTTLRDADAPEKPERDFIDEAYFSLIRNFRRHTWLLLYLFGASPAVCASFIEGRPHRLQRLSADSYYLPYATSLRMGPLGYQSDAQRSLAVSYNSLQGYAQSIRAALSAPYPAYERIGVRVDGQYRQLSDTLLQIENEFYGTIRPKRTIRSGERPLHALGERGVQYVEVRCLDVDPFSPVGIDASTMHFVDVFLLHCLLADSPPDSPAEISLIATNQHLVAQQGRQPGLMLERPSGTTSLQSWSNSILNECEPIAAALDAACECSVHRDALDLARQRLAEPDSTPSARVLAQMHQEHDDAFLPFALTRSQEHREYLLSLPIAAEVLDRFSDMAERSIDEQMRIESQDTEPFAQFLARYLALDALSAGPV